MTLQTSLSLCARLAACSILISSLELLVNRQLLREDGLLSWSLGRLRLDALVAGRAASLWHLVSTYPNIVVIHAAAVMIAASMAAGPVAWSISPLPALALGAVYTIANVRTHYGHDGADQLAGFVMLSIGVSGLAPTDVSRIACIGFLTFQACLAYGTAGWAKLPMPGWRDGTYLTAILSTEVYGTPAIGRFLAAHPMLARAATLGVLAWECTFPLALVLPAPFAYTMLALGLVFHATNAVVMRLNTFVWSFAATYPAVIWVVQHRGW